MLILQVVAWFILGWLAVGLVLGVQAASKFSRVALVAALVVVVGMIVGSVLRYFGMRFDVVIPEAASFGYSAFVAAIGLLAGYNVAMRHKPK